MFIGFVGFLVLVPFSCAFNVGRMGRHGPPQEKKILLIEDEAHTMNPGNEFKTWYFSPESPVSSRRPPGIAMGSICCAVSPTICSFFNPGPKGSISFLLSLKPEHHSFGFT